MKTSISITKKDRRLLWEVKSPAQTPERDLSQSYARRAVEKVRYCYAHTQEEKAASLSSV